MFGTIRSTLIVMVLVAVMPLVCFYGWTANKIYSLEKNAALDKAKDAVLLADFHIRKFLRSVEAVGEGGEEGLRRLCDLAGCRISGIADGDGTVRSAYPGALAVSTVQDAGWFREVKLTGKLISLRCSSADPFCGGEGFLFAGPLTGCRESFCGSFFFVLDDGWLLRLVEDMHLPAGSALNVRDSDGRVLLRYPDPGKWVGQALPAPVLSAMKERPFDGAVIAQGIDGVEKVYGYRFIEMGRGGGRGFFVSVGIPLSRIFLVSEKLWKFFGVLFAVTLVIALFLASGIARRFILHPLQVLGKHIEVLGLGRFERLRGERDWPVEFLLLTGSFNEMVERAERALKDLRASEERFRVLVNHIPVVVYQGEKSNGLPRYSFVGPRITEILGIQEVSLPLSGVEWVELIHPADRARFCEEMRRFLESDEKIFRSEYRLMGAYGDVVYVRDEAVKAVLAGREILFGVWRNISWRVAGERQLKLLRSCVDSTSVLFAIVTFKGVIIYANEAFKGFFGSEGLKFYDTVAKKFPSSEALQDMMNSLQEAREWKGRLVVSSTVGSGAERCFEVTVTPVTWEGEVFSIVAFYDVSDRAALERRLLLTQKMEALGTLAGGIAHDFNNILMIIMGFTELAMQELGEEHQARRYLGEVLQGCNRARNIVSQILTFARSGEEDAKMPFSLGSVIKEAVKFLRQIIPVSVEMAVNIEVSPGLDDIVYGSPTKIHQVLMNLCSNAVDAMEGKGKMEISLRRVSDGEEALSVPLGSSKWVELSVKDTGCGIDPAIQGRIFEPFFTTKPPGKGTGLGLSVVYGIVQEHNGLITVESAPGEGACFRVYLPIIEAFEEVGEKAGKAEEDQQASQKYGKARQILIVDDEEQVGRFLAIGLGQRGYATRVCTDPLKALDLVKEAYFDGIVLDHAMPGITGVELAERIRSLKPDIPMVLISGYVDDTLLTKARKAGVSHVLVKPVSVSNILDAFKEALCEGERDN